MPHHWQHHPFGMTSNMIIIVTFIYHFVQNESNGWFFLGFFKRRKNHKHQAHNRSRLTQTILTDSMNKKNFVFIGKYRFYDRIRYYFCSSTFCSAMKMEMSFSLFVCYFSLEFHSLSVFVCVFYYHHFRRKNERRKLCCIMHPSILTPTETLRKLSFILYQFIQCPCITSASWWWWSFVVVLTKTHYHSFHLVWSSSS